MNNDASSNEFGDATAHPGEPEVQAKPAGYCRACGKPLAEAGVNRVDGVIYCRDHAPAPPPPLTPPYVPPAGSPWTAQPAAAAAQGVSPGLAFVLGLIPGVGAIYNGQYAKGLIHVVIFGLLISIMESGAAGFGPLLGLVIAVWYMYMPFEAYHTAKKRRAGEPVDEFSSIIPLKNKQAGSVVGPIILIATGVLFLLVNLDLIKLYEVMRFWPVVLIVLGGYLLWARLSGQRGGEA